MTKTKGSASGLQISSIINRLALIKNGSPACKAAHTVERRGVVGDYATIQDMKKEKMIVNTQVRGY